MKKTLIALSLAAVSSAAFADVTIYGQVKAGVEVTKVETATSETKVVTNLNDFGSRIGFKGHEALGDGLNAIWKVESSTPVSGTGETWGNRQAYIGLESRDFGTVRAGKMSNVLDDMGTVDPWEYTGGVNAIAGLGKFTRTGDKELSVRYDSPVFAGFSGSVQYIPRDNQDSVARLTPGVTSVDQSKLYVGLNYEQAGFFGKYGYGYAKNAVAGVAGKDAHVHRVEAGYDANNLFVAVGYQYDKGFTDVDPKKGEEAFKGQELAVTAAYRFGNVTPKLSYANGFSAKNFAGKKLDKLEYQQVIAGVDYDFSKRTTAFAQVGYLDQGKAKADKVKGTQGVVGLRHKF